MGVPLMILTNRIFSAAIALLLAAATAAHAQDPRLCSEQGDPVADAPFDFVDGFCISAVRPIGNPGETANVLSFGAFPANDAGQLDVFVIWEPEEIGVLDGQKFTYSSSLSWTSNQPDAIVKEWVGNFNPSPDNPFAVMITDSAQPSLTPPEYAMSGTSATVSGRVIESDAFPPPIGRYHIQVTGLEPGEMVSFGKIGNGGTVIPEPSSALLSLLAFLSLAAFGRRRRAK